MLKTYTASQSLNRMGHEGDVTNARKIYLDGSNRNLGRLLRNRFTWMNSFVSSDDEGLELGAGIGASRDFLNVKSFMLTDFLDSDWLDVKNVDALATEFDSERFDFIIASNMIHHLAFPKIFFDECHRILKPGGKLIIQEIQTSIVMRIVLRMMRHEGYDETINVFDESKPCNQPGNPWSANCSIPKLLFRSYEKFEEAQINWKIVHDRKVEFFQFLNSGGVVAETRYLPLNNFFLNIQDYIDKLLCALAPDLFALQRQTVLEKKFRQD